MTDGIIQEVFKKYNSKKYLNLFSNRKLLQNLEQELIEKIKQEFKAEINCGCDLCESGNNYCRRLIGDTA